MPRGFGSRPEGKVSKFDSTRSTSTNLPSSGSEMVRANDQGRPRRNHQAPACENLARPAIRSGMSWRGVKIEQRGEVARGDYFRGFVAAEFQQLLVAGHEMLG